MLKIISILWIIVLITACGINCSEPGKERSGVSQLTSRSTQWQEKSIQNYVLSYEIFCFCQRQITEVTVTEGNISQVTLKNSDGENIRVITENEFSNYYKVDDLFDLIIELDKSVDKLTVEYNESLGYPSTIAVDPHAYRCSCDGACSDVVDDEYTYRVTLQIPE